MSNIRNDAEQFCHAILGHRYYVPNNSIKQLKLICDIL